MAKYQNLINSISSVIRTNGNNEITGQILQDVLKSIVNVVGANPTYGGVAHPADNPGTPDGGVVYIASDEGTYVNFGGLTLADNELAVLVWDGESWSKESVTYIEDFDDIEQAKQEALDAIAEAIQGLNIYYTIEEDKGAVKDVQLKDGQGNKLMPRTKAEVISIDIIHNNEYKGFVAGQYWLPAGLTSTDSHFSAHTDLIEVKQGDVIIVENYRTYASATGGGPFCAIYPTNSGEGGTRYNCNDVLVPDPSVSLKYTFTVPQDGWIGINFGSQNQSYINACIIIHQHAEEEALQDLLNEKADKELLDDKVDKEEGKNLIDDEYAEGVHYVDNAEFAYLKMDADNAIIEGVKSNGQKYLPKPSNQDDILQRQIDSINEDIDKAVLSL